jgi:hypothetical protein
MESEWMHRIFFKKSLALSMKTRRKNIVDKLSMIVEVVVVDKPFLSTTAEVAVIQKPFLSMTIMWLSLTIIDKLIYDGPIIDYPNL